MTGGDGVARLIRPAESVPWQESPTPGVRRRRFLHEGSAEAGRVTSLVRFDPGTRFPHHPHPEGEEILVLEGVFSDHLGDWPAGTWLGNPEGFDHAPFSEPGCTLFVKLRQYPGARPMRAVDTRGTDGTLRLDGGRLVRRSLLEEEPWPERILVEDWAAGRRDVLRVADGFELFVVDGAVEIDGEPLGRWGWARLQGDAAVRLRALVATRLRVTLHADAALGAR